jgi:hypothetical protein
MTPAPASAGAGFCVDRETARFNGRHEMAKGQQRTGREKKKTKQDKKSAAPSAYRSEMTGKPAAPVATPPRKG